MRELKRKEGNNRDLYREQVQGYSCPIRGVDEIPISAKCCIGNRDSTPSAVIGNIHVASASQEFYRLRIRDWKV